MKNLIVNVNVTISMSTTDEALFFVCSCNNVQRQLGTRKEAHDGSTAWVAGWVEFKTAHVPSYFLWLPGWAGCLSLVRRRSHDYHLS